MAYTSMFNHLYVLDRYISNSKHIGPDSAKIYARSSKEGYKGLSRYSG